MITERFSLGAETVTVTVDVNDTSSGDLVLTGDVSGVIDVGVIGRLTGSVNLVGDLHVRGTLTCDTQVDLDGNGFEIHTHAGGRILLEGAPKTGWVRWGEPVTGWEVGDRLAVAPWAVNVYTPSFIVWPGSWSGLTAPAPVLMPNGVSYLPEVANLTRSVTLTDVSRIMIHEADQPTVHSLRHIAVVNSGRPELGFYPIHFHLNGDHSRGSLVEGVVVEGGKHHAFVPHGSHGITFRDCVAVETVSHAYWWDLPPDTGDTVNDTDDLLYEHCLSLGTFADTAAATNNTHTQGGFLAATGQNVSMIDCAAAGSRGGSDNPGVEWNSSANHHPNNVWIFDGFVSHNNHNGAYVWQNDQNHHVVENFVAFRNKRDGILHGAYRNGYEYIDPVLAQNGRWDFAAHAVGHGSALNGSVKIVGGYIDHFEIDRHNLPPFNSISTIQGTQIQQLTIDETNSAEYGLHDFIDTGLTAADVNVIFLRAGSQVRIYQSGVLIAQYP